MRAARAEQSPAVCALRSSEICAHIVADVAYRDATVLAGYVAVGAEADPTSLLRAAHADGKRVAVPRVESGGKLSMRLWTPDAVLVVGPMGLSEPSADAAVVPPADLQLVIVPGLAFDLRGGRVGYGKGYYDRLLHLAPAALRVGMAFSLQVVTQVPMHAHDLPMHRVATEDALHVCPDPAPRAT